MLLPLLAAVVRAAPDDVDWTGTWETKWRGAGAILHLRQDGDRVTGSYPLYHGTVEGSAAGRSLDGRWSEKSGRSGSFLFTLSEDGNDFMGRFDSGEWWTGRRLSDSHEYETAPPDLSSPRETLRSFIAAANAARGGFIERIRPGLATIDFSNPGWSSTRSVDGTLFPQDKLDYARSLFQTLDELTFRIWDLPGRALVEASAEPTVTVTLEQAGTSQRFELSFVRRGDSWLIDPPTPTVLDAALERLCERHGEMRPGARDHLLLRNPRDTMRTFLEGMGTLDTGGWEEVRRSMDLENLGGGIHEEEARLLAHYLKHVIDRIGFVIYQEIPDDPRQHDVYVHFRHGAGDIVIAPGKDSPSGSTWRFDASTLRTLRHLYAAVEDMPEVAGVTTLEHPSPFFALRSWLRQYAPSLLQRIGPIEAWQWLSIILFLFTSIAAAWLMTFLVLLLLRRRRTWAQAVVSGHLRLALVWPLRITFVGYFWYLKIGALGLPETTSGPVRSIAATLAIGSSVWLIYRGLGLIGRFSSRTIGTAGQSAIFTSLSLGILRIVVVVAGALLMAENWSLPYSSVLAGLGVGGLALALAAKETIQNMIAGFTLFADSPLTVGDFCRYGDKLGWVEQIGLRSTRIRTRERTVVSIPNSEFANMQLENFAKRDRVLLRTTIGLRYETTPDQLRFVLATLRQLLIEHPKISPDPARVRMVGFGHHSLDVEVYAYVLTADWNEYLGIREDLYLRMMRIIEESGAQIAFPSQVNYLARDGAVDPVLTKEAEEAVALWRREGRLPFPEFSTKEVEDMEGRLDYPPEGSPAPEAPKAELRMGADDVESEGSR